jgi:hypothetical protein
MLEIDNDRFPWLVRVMIERSGILVVITLEAALES